MNDQVKRYTFKGAAGTYVYSADFDALAEQLAARNTRLQEILNEVSAMEKRQAALQGLLNERDQQVDDAVGLLRCAPWSNWIWWARDTRAFLSNSETKEHE